MDRDYDMSILTAIYYSAAAKYFVERKENCQYGQAFIFEYTYTVSHLGPLSRAICLFIAIDSTEKKSISSTDSPT